MKYLIVTLIKGKAGEYQQKLMYSVAEKFNVSGAIERRPPAHITIKSSFEIENVKPIEDCIESFCNLHKKCKYEINGFNHFEHDVIFLDIHPSNSMKRLYAEFIECIKANTSLEFKKWDGETHFHSSIAHTDIKEKFDKIWSYVTREKPSFDVVMDNISILKLEDKVWKKYKEYSLK